MQLIGIAGGVASGKSLVASQLARLGAKVLDADAIGHDVLRLPQVKQAVRAQWGDAVFGFDGEVLRSALARIVFAPTPDGHGELLVLERITHPVIRERMERQLEQWRDVRSVRAAVLDAPVMFKAGWDKLCDVILYVDAPDHVRQSRALARGWSEAEYRARQSAQKPLAAKRERADHVIDNSGSAEQTRRQVARFWRDLIEPS